MNKLVPAGDWLKDELARVVEAQRPYIYLVLELADSEIHVGHTIRVKVPERFK